MFGRVVVVSTLALLAGCGSGDGSASRVERCTERFLARTESATPETRRYVETAYCARFEQRGWLYEDGSLKLAAYTERGEEECEAQAGGETGPVPCPERVDPTVLDCALLDHVRRDEVETYVAGLQRSRTVRCDDDTPLSELGAT